MSGNERWDEELNKVYRVEDIGLKDYLRVCWRVVKERGDVMSFVGYKVSMSYVYEWGYGLCIVDEDIEFVICKMCDFIGIGFYVFFIGDIEGEGVYVFGCEFFEDGGVFGGI